MNKSYTKNQIEFLSTLANNFPMVVQQAQSKNTPCVFSRKQLLNIKVTLGYSVIPVWVTNDPERKAGRAMYSFPELNAGIDTLTVSDDTRGAPRRVLSSRSTTTTP